MKQQDIPLGSGPDVKQIHGSHLMTKKQKEQKIKEMQEQPIEIKPPKQNVVYIFTRIDLLKCQSIFYDKKRNDNSKVNFQKWVLILVSFASMILTLTLIYLGFSSSSLIEHTMYADKALVLLGGLTCILNMITIFATYFNNKKKLLLIVYIDFVMIVQLLIYAFGCITFQPNMQQWVYSNWETIQDKVKKQTFVEFQQDIENQIVSLGVTALTISIGFAISISFIVLRIHLKRILMTFVPAFAIMFIVFGLGLLYLTIYALVHLDFIDIPFWMNTFSLCLAGVLILIGTIGYFASLFKMRKLTIFYLTCVSIISLLILMCCIGYLILSNRINMYVEEFWPEIRENLDRAGIWMPRSTFTTGLILNIKFSGLYGLSFFFFLVVGLAGSIYHVHSEFN